MQSQEDIRSVAKPEAASSGDGPARIDAVSRTATAAAAERSQRRLVQLSLLLCPGGR